MVIQRRRPSNLWERRRRGAKCTKALVERSQARDTQISAAHLPNEQRRDSNDTAVAVPQPRQGWDHFNLGLASGWREPFIWLPDRPVVGRLIAICVAARVLSKRPGKPQMLQVFSRFGHYPPIF